MDDRINTRDAATMLGLTLSQARCHLKAKGLTPEQEYQRGPITWCRSDVELCAEHLQENRQRFITTGEVCERIGRDRVQTTHLLQAQGFEAYEVLEELGAAPDRSRSCWDLEEIGGWIKAYNAARVDAWPDGWLNAHMIAARLGVCVTTAREVMRTTTLPIQPRRVLWQGSSMSAWTVADVDAVCEEVCDG
jgi:hypothetical protein